MKMNVTVYVGANKIKPGFEIGWFSGNEWRLLNIDLFYKMDGYPSLHIFDIQILKFNVALWVEWEK
jgi:hypothetical protein